MDDMPCESRLFLAGSRTEEVQSSEASSIDDPMPSLNHRNYKMLDWGQTHFEEANSTHVPQLHRLGSTSTGQKSLGRERLKQVERYISDLNNDRTIRVGRSFRSYSHLLKITASTIQRTGYVARKQAEKIRRLVGDIYVPIDDPIFMDEIKRRLLLAHPTNYNSQLCSRASLISFPHQIAENHPDKANCTTTGNKMNLMARLNVGRRWNPYTEGKDDVLSTTRDINSSVYSVTRRGNYYTDQWNSPRSKTVPPDNDDDMDFTTATSQDGTKGPIHISVQLKQSRRSGSQSTLKRVQFGARAGQTKRKGSLASSVKKADGGPKLPKMLPKTVPSTTKRLDHVNNVKKGQQRKQPLPPIRIDNGNSDREPDDTSQKSSVAEPSNTSEQGVSQLNSTTLKSNSKKEHSPNPNSIKTVDTDRTPSFEEHSLRSLSERTNPYEELWPIRTKNSKPVMKKLREFKLDEVAHYLFKMATPPGFRSSCYGFPQLTRSDGKILHVSLRSEKSAAKEVNFLYSLAEDMLSKPMF